MDVGPPPPSAPLSTPPVFPFAFDPRFRPLLALLGVTPERSRVTVGGGRLVARFGPFVVDTPLANVADARITGPFRWFKAIGPRLSLADRGVTFGSNADRGACVTFVEPVRALDATGRLRHPGLTVTVVDPEGLVAALRPADR